MLSLVKRLRNNILTYFKKKQFDANALYGEGCKFDITAGCRNESHDPYNIQIGAGCMIRGLVSSTGKGKIIIGDRFYMGGRNTYRCY